MVKKGGRGRGRSSQEEDMAKTEHTEGFILLIKEEKQNGVFIFLLRKSDNGKKIGKLVLVVVVVFSVPSLQEGSEWRLLGFRFEG